MSVILIVDDQSLGREYMVMLLGYAGHTIFEAASAPGALALARKERPDLVITDLRMPGMDGVELVLQLRKEPATARTPVIFYTATYLQEEARVMANQCGIAEVLMKPCGSQEILAVVAASLGTSVFKPPEEVAVALQQQHHHALTNHPMVLRLADLMDLAQRMTRERDPLLLLEKFCQGARYILSARFSAALILGTSTPIVSSGSLKRAQPVSVDLTADNLPARVVAARKTIRVRDLAEPLANLGLAADGPPAESFLGAPIMVADKLYGVLYFAGKYSGPEFDGQDEFMVSTMATQLGVAWHNATLLAELQAAEARYRLLVEQMPAITFVSDSSDPWRMHYVSPQIEEMFGFPCTDWLASGERWRTQVHPEDRLRISGCFARPVSPGDRFLEEYRILSRTGAIFWVQHRALATRDPGRASAGDSCSLKGFLVDITDRKQAEESLLTTEAQLRQSQKMEAFGQLAGGIAHDFNNLLSVILGYSKLLVDEFDPGDPRCEMIRVINGAGGRGAQLTRQLLAFSRKQVLTPRILDLNALLSTTVVSMLRRLIGEDIDIRMELDPALGHILADPGQIEQVVLNLAVNARDAMPGGGQLTVTTRNRVVTAGSPSDVKDLPEGEYVLLSVTDTGCGMSTKVRARIFEPFFTTKPEGKGTGLGLATVFGIVEQTGGRISVTSEVGRGTSFDVYLAHVEQPVSPERLAPARPGGGTETVLLVEDDDNLRSLITRILTRGGYHVLTATTGLDSVDVSGKYSGPVQLMLADVVMPGLAGPEAARILSASRPDMRVLYMSGYTDRETSRHPAIDATRNFIQKPFTAESLLSKIRETLDHAVPA